MLSDYYMSLTRRVAHNTIIQIVGKAVSTLLGLIAIGLLGRYLGVEKFGWYTTAITFLQFAGILVDFGLIPVTARMLSEGIFEKTKLLQNLLAYRFTTAFIFFGITPLLAWLFPYPTEVKWAIALLSISFLAIAMNQIFTGYYQRELAMHVPVIGEIVGRIVLVSGLFFGRIYNVGFLPLMIVVTLSSVTYTLIMWLMAARREQIGLAFDGTIWRAITTTMWPIAISIVFNVIYLKGDTILMSLYRSQIEVGWYGAAYRVVDILTQLAMLMMGVMLPLLTESWTRKNLTEFKERYQHSFDTIMVFAVPVTIGTILLAQPIMRFIFGMEFETSGQMLQWLAVAVFGVYLGAVFGHTAVAIGKQKATMWIYISDAVITFVGYLIAIPRFGWQGAAGFTVFSELYAGLLLAWVIRRHSPVHLSFGRLGKILLATAAMSLVIFLTSQRFPVIAVALLGVVMYGAILYAIGGIKKETVREILIGAKN